MVLKCDTNGFVEQSSHTPKALITTLLVRLYGSKDTTDVVGMLWGVEKLESGKSRRKANPPKDGSLWIYITRVSLQSEFQACLNGISMIKSVRRRLPLFGSSPALFRPPAPE